MKQKYRFCIGEDCRLACVAENEGLAWLWLSRTKNLAVKEVKKLYRIEKIENNDD